MRFEGTDKEKRMSEDFLSDTMMGDITAPGCFHRI